MKKLELTIPSAFVSMKNDEHIVFFTVKVLKTNGGQLREVRMDVPTWMSLRLPESTDEEITLE